MKNFMCINSRHVLCLQLGIIISLFLFFVPIQIKAMTFGKDYFNLVKNTLKVPTDDVMKKADEYFEKNSLDTAFIYYLVLCKRADIDLPNEERQQCAIAFLKKGNILYMKGSYADALNSYFTGLRIYKEGNGKREISRFYNNIGTIFCLYGDFGNGLGYYKKAYNLSRKYKDAINEYKVLANITMMTARLGKNKEARKYHKLLIKFKKSKDKERVFMWKFCKGMIFYSEKNNIQAIQVLKEAVDYAQKNNLTPQYICSSYQMLYKSYSALKDDRMMLKYIRLYKEAAEKYGIMHSCLSVYMDYADYYDSVKDYKLANHYMKLYLDTKDSILNFQEFETIKNQQFVYEMAKYDEYISNLHERDKERMATISIQRNFILVIIVVVLVVSVLLIIVYRQKKSIDKSYNNLFVVNRDFIKNQNVLRVRMHESMLRQKELEAEVERMRKTIDNGVCNRSEEIIKCDSDTCDDNVEKVRNASMRMSGDMRNKLLDAIIDIMENTTEFCNYDFSLLRLSTLVGSNSKYVSMVINDNFQKSFKTYVNEYRIHLACLRMSDTENYGSFTLNAIAESVGFKSYSAFVDVFKKTVGITPSLYKEKLRKE